jgi:hypothetical protein
VKNPQLTPAQFREYCDVVAASVASTCEVMVPRVLPEIIAMYQTCEACGVLVVNPDAHREWHGRINRQIRQERAAQ